MKAAAISSVRVFIRTEGDRHAIDACKSATGEATAAKALMVAAKSYPSAMRRLAEAERELADLRQLRADIRRGLGVE